MEIINNRQWSPHSNPYKDIQKTLPLTCRLLALLPATKIHHSLTAIFGASICTRGDDLKNDMYRAEARNVAAQFPPVETFEGSLLDKVTRDVSNPYLRKVVFVLGLLGVPGRTDVTAEDSIQLKAIKEVLEEEEDTQELLLEVILCLVEWEFQDRCKIALRCLDPGFKFTKQQARVLWCVMALYDREWVDSGVLDDLQKMYGLWKSDTVPVGGKRPGVWADMRTLSACTSVDLATFVLSLRKLEYEDVDQPWSLAFRARFKLENRELWTLTDVVRFMFCLFSPFGYQGMVGYHLTVEQRLAFLQVHNIKEHITVTDMVDSVIMAVNDPLAE